jgi:hypothetical protein
MVVLEPEKEGSGKRKQDNNNAEAQRDAEIRDRF